MSQLTRSPYVRRFHSERLDQAGGDGDSERGVLHARAGTVRPDVSTDAPACHGFTIIAKIKPGTEDDIRAYGRHIENTIAASPHALAALQIHYLRWVLFDIGQETYFMLQGIFDTDLDKYAEDAVLLFKEIGTDTIFENLEGFPTDWKTNVPAFIRFVREHECPSFLEYGEYPYVSATEIKKALALKQAFSSMLDQMQ